MDTMRLVKQLVAGSLVAGSMMGLSAFSMADDEQFNANTQTMGTESKVSKVDINTASLTELMGLPGITRDDAQKIIDNRPYSSTRDLVNKNVLSHDMFQQIRKDVVAKPAKSSQQPSQMPSQQPQSTPGTY